MTPRTRRTLWLLLLSFVAAYGGVVLVAHYETREYALSRATEQIENLLLTHRAIHSYVEEAQKPELYRLKQEGKLYPEYFAPQTLSFTFIARNIKDRLNQERVASALPPIYFKLASDNPRNPINAADAEERELLRRMNEEQLTEYRRLHTGDDGQLYLYYALPIAPNKGSCLLCHGDPTQAPEELLAIYGESAGFGEPLGRIRALISARVPLGQDLAAARHAFFWIAGVALAALAAVYLLIVAMMRKLDAKNQALERLSESDVLTELYNRAKFIAELKRETALADRHDHPLALIMADVDHFKQVNDTRGHCVGDEVLAAFACRLRSAVRSTDIVARWGGEEFIIAAPMTDLGGAATTAEKLRAAVAASPLEPGVPITASFGVTEFNPGESIERFIERADRLLYRSKTTGRNRVSAA